MRIREWQGKPCVFKLFNARRKEAVAEFENEVRMYKTPHRLQVRCLMCRRMYLSVLQQCRKFACPSWVIPRLQVTNPLSKDLQFSSSVLDLKPSEALDNWWYLADHWMIGKFCSLISIQHGYFRGFLGLSYPLSKDLLILQVKLTNP